ncbi:MAG TPA: hypothetical protein VFS30_16925 [Dehalococcoidia bacterium]|nr:hypothetical protein [Dehalococcoidia bacterium]
MKREITLALLAALALATAVSFAPITPAAATQQIDPTHFSSQITNTYLPLSLVGPKLFIGEETDDEGEAVETRLESRLLPETTVVAGVTVAILEERAYEDGELVEVALDYFAQDANGDVYYFGEAVDNYVDGVLENHDGQWLAGEGDNEPGLFMPAAPRAGVTLTLEYAPGIAEDMAIVLTLGEPVNVPAGKYTNCLKTREFTPLEPDIEEFKYYCPGVGMVKEEGDGAILELVSIRRNGSAPPAEVDDEAGDDEKGTTIQPPATGDGGLR